MNGYFQLCMNEQGTFLKLIPETDGGEPIEIGEVAEYLEFEKIPFELTDIRDAVLSGKLFDSDIQNGRSDCTNQKIGAEGGKHALRKKKDDAEKRERGEGVVNNGSKTARAKG